MAQPMMHLLIADKIYTEKSGSTHSYGDFLLGSIAPDAVHVKEDYTREQVMFREKNAPCIIEAINRGKSYSLEGLIDAEDVIVWREKLNFDYNHQKSILLHTKYISEQNIRDYIANCAGECIAYLRNLPS